LKGELRKISEKDLTVKDFGCPEALCEGFQLYVKFTLKFENIAKKKPLGILGHFYCFYEV